MGHAEVPQPAHPKALPQGNYMHKEDSLVMLMSHLGPGQW